MDFALFEKIAAEITSADLMPEVLFELHNEPLIDKRTFNWVKHIKTRSPNKRCVVITNGEILDKYSPSTILESELDRITISLNAYSKETYEKINLGLDYERVMRNIANIVSNPLLRPKLMLYFVLTEENVHEIHDAMKYWRGLGVNTKVGVLTNRAGMLNNYENLKLKTNYGVTNHLTRLRERLWGTFTGSVLGCALPFNQMNILFNGDVIICSQDWGKTTVVGNAVDNTLEQIWNSEKITTVRRLLLSNKYEQLDSCRGCSIVQKG